MERSAIEHFILRWLQQAIAQGHAELFDELLAENVCDRSGSAPAYGSASFKARARAVQQAFSQIETVLEELVVGAGGQHIAWRWSLSGTHIGTFAGVAASGRRVTLRGVNFQRFEAGRVLEHWTSLDKSDLF